jgi:hypothetical protein
MQVMLGSGAAHTPQLSPCTPAQHALWHWALDVHFAWHDPSLLMQVWPAGPIPVPDWQHMPVVVQAPPGDWQPPVLPELLLPELPLPELPVPELPLPGHGVLRGVQFDVSELVKQALRAASFLQSKKLSLRPQQYS